MQLDQIIRSKRKTIGIEVRPGGTVTVRAPLYTSDESIFTALEKKAAWISAARLKMQAMETAQKLKIFQEGELFWYLGRQYPLQIVDRRSPPLSFTERQGFTLARAHKLDAKDLFIAWYRKQTRKLMTELIHKYQKRHGFAVSALRITSAKTRWGSCSSKNNINFTYRLCMAPISAVEYVVVHELVHTRIKNHSVAYWKALLAIYPNYKKERAWLKKHGLHLNL